MPSILNVDELVLKSGDCVHFVEHIFFPSFVRLIVSFSFFLVCDTALEFQLLPLNLMWEEMKDFVPFCVSVSV